ncbi:negative cofactor 2beta isoform X2 [Dermacentor variabilis]|uniref:negative cofactor 2beta isoform X2 n=1 Tax=Dermacentor variabilis TaxID=34621 RepID=UPI003F5B1327
MNSRHTEVALKKEAASAEDEDLTIPRAAMNKMIKELLPNVRIANEARELILACCTEFIHHLSTEANDICNRQQKKTISADHVLGDILLQKSKCKHYSSVCRAAAAGVPGWLASSLLLVKVRRKGSILRHAAAQSTNKMSHRFSRIARSAIFRSACATPGGGHFCFLR